MTEKATDRFSRLTQVKPGDHRVLSCFPKWKFWKPRERTGWLMVEQEPNGQTDVMWLSSRHNHDPVNGFGPAWSITLNADGQVVCYMESANAFHVVWDSRTGNEEQRQRALKMSHWAQSKLCDGGAIFAEN